jgi:hypothetical protein
MEECTMSAVILPFRHGTVTDPGIEPGDCVTTNRGYFDNGCTFGDVQRFEDADAYVDTAGGLIRVPLSELILAL